MLFCYVISCSGQVSLLSSTGWERVSGQGALAVKCMHPTVRAISCQSSGSMTSSVLYVGAPVGLCRRLVFSPHRTHSVHRCGLLLQMSSVVCMSVCVCVCVYVTTINPAKRLNRSICPLEAHSRRHVEGTIY